MQVEEDRKIHFLIKVSLSRQYTQVMILRLFFLKRNYQVSNFQETNLRQNVFKFEINI